jgi:polysaccharide deacetylase 2 family uncharacterized protein YibQ
MPPEPGGDRECRNPALRDAKYIRIAHLRSGIPRILAIMKKILLIVFFLSLIAALFLVVLKFLPREITPAWMHSPVASLRNGGAGLLSGVSIVQQRIADKLTAMEVAPEDLSIASRNSPITIKTHIPRGQPIEYIIGSLSSAVEGTTYHVEDCVVDEKERTFRLSFASDNSRKPAIVVSADASNRYYSQTARMAIVIENFGFAADQTTIACLSFPEPLTFSLVPSRKLSGLSAKIAREYRKEIILRLPMESAARSGRDSSDLTIMVHYPEATIRKLIAGAIGIVPDFSGFGNYQGSRVLEDSRVMSIVLDEIKKHKGYFIADQPYPRGVGPLSAKAVGCAYAEVQMSVDGKGTQAQIEAQLDRCAATAQSNGSLIVSSTATGPFIGALKNKVASFKHNGIKLTFVSDIVKE